MAYLILRDENADVDNEYYYDFNPNDNSTLEKIEALLSKKNNNDESIRKQIEQLTEESNRSSEKQLENVGKFYQWIIKKLGSIISPKKIFHSKKYLLKTNINRRDVIPV